MLLDSTGMVVIFPPFSLWVGYRRKINKGLQPLVALAV
jgi:hypothetical protein